MADTDRQDQWFADITLIVFMNAMMDLDYTEKDLKNYSEAMNRLSTKVPWDVRKLLKKGLFGLDGGRLN